MKKILTISVILVGIILLSNGLGSCHKNNPNKLQWISQPLPPGFPPPAYRFEDNPLSWEGYQLGKRLFYDGLLSKDGNFPCSSCHEQSAAFGTYQHDRSHGYNGSHTLRNAPVLFNLAWQKQFHWDGEFLSLAEEAAQPINGHIEMAESFAGVIEKLQRDKSYRDQFRKVFRSPFITPDQIMKALAQFTGYLTSANAKYDRVKRGEGAFTSQEASGYTVFQAKCSSCHPEPMFTDYAMHNIGLPVDPFLNDFGRMRISKMSADSLKFKTPTLRNLYFSSNYMHDGRFNTVSQCVNHYRSGVQPGPTLDPFLVNGILLNNTEANDLISFLKTLTDSGFVVNPTYGK